MNFYFRKQDQVAVAIVLVIAMAAVLCRYALLNRTNGVIDIETEQRREYQFTIDINSAEWPEIALVPGIGKELATRIENYRTQHGDFSSHHDLLNVDGIGPGKLQSLQKFLSPLGNKQQKIDSNSNDNNLNLKDGVFNG